MLPSRTGRVSCGGDGLDLQEDRTRFEGAKQVRSKFSCNRDQARAGIGSELEHPKVKRRCLHQLVHDALLPTREMSSLSYAACTTKAWGRTSGGYRRRLGLKWGSAETGRGNDGADASVRGVGGSGCAKGVCPEQGCRAYSTGGAHGCRSSVVCERAFLTYHGCFFNSEFSRIRAR